MISLDDMIKDKWIEGEQLYQFRTIGQTGPKFIEQLADLLVELHSLPHGPDFATYDDIPESNMRDDIDDLVNWSDKDILCEELLYDFYDIKSILNKRFYIHGDLWKENIIVDEEGNLSGLRNWDAFSYGDPHWDFRMIGRWMGSEDLDKLLFLYNSSVNWNCKREYIEILDKISLQTSKYLSFRFQNRFGQLPR